MTASGAMHDHGITHLFFDVGGVLGTSGWSTADRAEAAAHFCYDGQEAERRHDGVVSALESGAMTLDEYLDHTVFFQPRPFTREAFTAFMRSRSVPNADTIALARALAATGRYHMVTLNNESEALNVYRIACFGLTDIFDAFLSSCWLGVSKPARRAYRLALALTQAPPSRSVFIDDREENLEPARDAGLHTIRFTSAADLRSALRALGINF
ncbi:MAG TPA: HAD family phosphatase [Candidatus Tumulicola sp.]|nr:HAD family phosphatase [Candidatus Tumulicola sp.]